MHKSHILSTQEYAPFYESYFQLNQENNIIQAMLNSEKELISMLLSISEEDFNYAYEQGKWTIKELMQHIIDNERVFGYRAMRFSRNDFTELPDYNEKETIPYSNANNRTKKEIIDEFIAVRKSSIALFSSFSKEMLLKKGIASKNYISVRALGYLISGHQRHHQNILKERYLELL
ncbi:DinB family protein [Aureivirga marina]|uniref:DinB family protein n=1 Tax=Aureivirga marina TaxID=1182451 RepID=UPI001E5EE0F1|nr:DinB family protein [Aureivirga marina]